MRVWWTALAVGLVLAGCGTSAQAKRHANPATAAAAPSAAEWTVNCTYDSKSQQCAMVTDVLAPDGHQIDARLELGRLGGTDTLFVTVPFNVLLDAGMALAVDQQKPVVFEYDLCNGNGCVVRAAFTDDVARLFEGGTKHYILVAGLDGRVARLEISMTGFEQAYRRYRETNAAGSEKTDTAPDGTKSLLAPYSR